MVLRVLWHSSSLGERRPEGFQLSQRAVSLMVHRRVDIVNLRGATALLSGQHRQLAYPTSFLEYAKGLMDQFHLGE
jgi:hypothetical protein